LSRGRIVPRSPCDEVEIEYVWAGLLHLTYAQKVS